MLIALILLLLLPLSKENFKKIGTTYASDLLHCRSGFENTHTVTM